SSGQTLLGDVARRSAIAEKPARVIEERVAADRNHPFGTIADLSFIDKVAERLMPVQKRQMLAPFIRFTGEVARQVSAGAADAGLRVLPKRADMFRQMRELMLPVRLPEPVG